MKYDLSMLRKLSDNDEAFILDMLLTFKRTAPPVIARMEEYASQQKPEAAGREAHKLIPGVSFLGAKDLETVLKKVEEKGKAGENSADMVSLIQEAKTLVTDLIADFENDFHLG
jgi:hypothetical protein